MRAARYFKDAPREFIHSLSEFLSLAIFGPNEAIIRVGFTGSKMYILAKGRCQIEWVNEETGDVKIVGEITDGSCFGELGKQLCWVCLVVFGVYGWCVFFVQLTPLFDLSLNGTAMLFQSRRSATVRTLKFCETLYLRRDNYMLVAKHFPLYAKRVRKSAIKVMWTNMLTSHTLKDALIRAAAARDAEKARAEVSVSDLTDQMRSIMTTMTARLLDMENEDVLKRQERAKMDGDKEKMVESKMEELKNKNDALRSQLLVGER